MYDTKFYAEVRKTVFGGKLSGAQFQGLQLILAEADRRGTNNEYLAYILATTAHETAYTIQPIREYGRGKGRKYGVAHAKTGQVYYGRGYVQLTWYENYVKATAKLGVDFVNKPDLVMEPRHAVRIMFEGMEDAWFTGKGLSDYLDGVDEPDAEDLREFSNARRIINGTDKQVAIGQLALKFEKALRAAGRPEGVGFWIDEKASPSPVVPVEAPETPKIPEAAPAAPQGLLSALFALLRKLFVRT